MPSLVAISTLVVEICFQFVTWSWRNEVTSTSFICLIWSKSCRFTCLPNLVVTGLMSINQFLCQFLHGYPGISWTQASMRHTARSLKLGILVYNSEDLDTAGWKTRKRRRRQAIAKRFAFHANAIKIHIIYRVRACRKH